MASVKKSLDIVGSILCEHCAGACCRYVALPIDKPRSLRDYDDLRWYLLHEGMTVFVEDGDWYVQVQARCKQLQADNLCGAYETRPEICREYQAGECDYGGGAFTYDLHFTHPKQVEAYVEEKLGKKLGAPQKKKRRTGRSRKKTA